MSLDAQPGRCQYLSMFRASLAVLVALSGLSACGATSGQEWLHTPIDEREVHAAELSEAPPALPSDERPRLRQTITLGESYASVASESAPAAAPGGSPVPVTVNTHVPVTVNNYATYGYGPGYRPAAPAPVRGAVPATGEDFPAPPSYGPSFPYRASPASPWR